MSLWRGDRIELQELLHKLQDKGLNGLATRLVKTRLAAVVAREAGDSEAHQIILETENEVWKNDQQ